MIKDEEIEAELVEDIDAGDAAGDNVEHSDLSEDASIEAAPAGGALAIETDPIEPDPIEAAPLEAAPLEAAPLEAAPLEAAPLEAAPLEEGAMLPISSDEAVQVEGVALEGESVVGEFVLEEWMLGTIESLVFASSEPLSAFRVREVLGAELAITEGREGMPEPTLADIKAAFRTLLERWSDPTRQVALGFRLVEIDGGLTFRTIAAQSRFVRRMQSGKPQRLSRASLETLAVIAYRQPATKPQVEEVRGVDCSGALKALLDKKLIRVLGKAEEIGRPLLYGTTKTFLEFFELASLTDLPTLKQLHELEHGITEPIIENDDRPAVIMDLFNADAASTVSAETEQESNDALEALERALGEAKDVAKRASSLVFGMQVEDEDGPSSSQAAIQALDAASADPIDDATPAAPADDGHTEAGPDETKT